jgi:hypothetical protein
LALQYAVKVLCGANGGREPRTKPAAGTDPRVAPGTYFTAINIHNPGERPVVGRMKVAVALPNGRPGPISKFIDFKLRPDEAVSIDCAELYERFGAKPIFTDGFTVIESEAELDVVAVYTAAGATGKVESLETERVPPRMQ